MAFHSELLPPFSEEILNFLISDFKTVEPTLNGNELLNCSSIQNSIASTLLAPETTQDIPLTNSMTWL